jgi:threonine dehydrogenase-like Zn-dependent dehydrogenase
MMSRNSKMPPATLDRAAAIMASGRIACDEIVTATIPLGEAQRAIADFNDRHNSQVKVAVNPWL